MQPTTSAPAQGRHGNEHTHTPTHMELLTKFRPFHALKDLLVGTPGCTVYVCQVPSRAKQTVSKTLENTNPHLQTPSYYQIRHNGVFSLTEMKDT